MNKTKILMGTVSAVLAASVTIVALSAADLEEIRNSGMPDFATVSFVGEVGPELADRVMKNLEAIKAATGGSEQAEILVEINSPGGRVDIGKTLIGHMTHADKNRRFDVLIIDFAASMAADTSMYAEELFMTDSSSILFHGASGGPGITLPVVKKLLELSKKIDDTLNPIERISKIIDIAKAEKIYGYQLIVNDIMAGQDAVSIQNSIADEVDQLATINQQGVDAFKAKMPKALRAVMTNDQIVERFFGNYEHNVVLSGREMIALGMAKPITELNMVKYKIQHPSASLSDVVDSIGKAIGRAVTTVLQ